MTLSRRSSILDCLIFGLACFLFDHFRNYKHKIYAQFIEMKLKTFIWPFTNLGTHVKYVE